MQIKIILKGDKLTAQSANLQHENHSTDPPTYACYPENLRLTEEQIVLARSELATDGNKQKLKRRLMDEAENR